MPSVSEMRKELYSKYAGPKWKIKVNKMGDRQVFAVWSSMKLREEKENSPKQLKLFEDLK